MPDWFIKRNGKDSPFPYHLRFGGCEYSLTEQQWMNLLEAMVAVDQSSSPLCIESEGYQGISYAGPAREGEVQELRAILGLKGKPVMTIRRS